MQTTYVHQQQLFVFTNENLEVGDKVFPISSGLVKKGIYHHTKFNFDEHIVGFPDAPHTIVNLNHSNDKTHQIRTNYGFGPIEIYFKVKTIRPLLKGLSMICGADCVGKKDEIKVTLTAEQAREIKKRLNDKVFDLWENIRSETNKDLHIRSIDVVYDLRIQIVKCEAQIDALNAIWGELANEQLT